MSINEVNKTALSPFDTTRFYHDDGIKSLAFRHYKTGQTRKLCIDLRENTFDKNVNCEQIYTKIFDGGFALEGQKEDALQNIEQKPGKDNEYNSDYSSSGESCFFLHQIEDLLQLLISPVMKAILSIGTLRFTKNHTLYVLML